MNPDLVLTLSREQLNASCDVLVEALEKALHGISYVTLDSALSQSPTAKPAGDFATADTTENEASARPGLSVDPATPAKKAGAPVQPLTVFSGYREKVLEATRDNYKLVRRMSVTFAQSLAKLVRSERGVSPEEWAQQRNFLIKEHLKQIESVRTEASVHLGEEERKRTEERERELEEMETRREAEVAAAEERSRAALEALEARLKAAHDAEVADLQGQLAFALKRLADGDFDLLSALTKLRDQLSSAEHDKGSLRNTINDMKDQELEFQKEIKRLRKDRELASASAEEMRKSQRASERQKGNAERREHKLTHDLQEARQEYHELEAKMMHDTHELGELRKKARELEETLAAAHAKLPQIAILTKKLDASTKAEKKTSELKEKVGRKCWVLENEVKQLHKDHSALVAEIDLLRAETGKQRQAQVVTELALKGVDEEVQRRITLVGGDIIRHETRLLLEKRAQELREEARLPLTQLRKGALTFSSDSTSSEEALRKRLLVRAAALELEMAQLPEVEEPPAVGLVAEARCAAIAAECDEEEGAELPLRVSCLSNVHARSNVYAGTCAHRTRARRQMLRNTAALLLSALLTLTKTSVGGEPRRCCHTTSRAPSDRDETSVESSTTSTATMMLQTTRAPP